VKGVKNYFLPFTNRFSFAASCSDFQNGSTLR